MASALTITIPNSSNIAWAVPYSDIAKIAPETSFKHRERVQISQCNSITMHSIDALLNCDAVELVCYQINETASADADEELDTQSLRIQWPLDVETPSHAKLKIAALRAIAGEEKPIGISIPLVRLCDEFFESIRWLLDCDLDWIHWSLPAASLGCEHAALPYMLNNPFNALDKIQAWQQPNSITRPNVPAIVIEYPWENGYEAGELIRKGASCIVVPSGSKILGQVPERDLHALRRDNFFPSGSLGATLGYYPSSILQSHANSNPQKPSSLEVFASQFRAMLDLFDS
jgi:hypothetical protein